MLYLKDGAENGVHWRGKTAQRTPLAYPQDDGLSQKLPSFVWFIFLI